MTEASKSEAGEAQLALGAAGSAGLGLGLVAGAMAAVPALARGGSVGLLGVALCSMAFAAPVCLGLRTLSASWLAWLALTLAASFTPLALGADALVRTTHHRPLGAVTFAVFACVLLAAMGLLVRRAMPYLLGRKLLLRGLLAGLLVIDGLQLARSQSPGALEATAWFVLVFLAALMPKGMLGAMPSARVQAALWLGALLSAGAWAVSAPESLSEASQVLSFPLRALMGRA